MPTRDKSFSELSKAQASHILTSRRFAQFGLTPHVKSYTILSIKEFDKRFNTSTITGKAGAITLPDHTIYVREGSELAGIHELVHASGFIKNKYGSDFVNEGLTEYTAALISGRSISGYKEELRFVTDKLVPATGIPIKQLISGYAKAANKSKYLADLIWRKHSKVFSNVRDWEAPEHARKQLEEELRGMIGNGIMMDEIYKTSLAPRTHRFTMRRRR